MGGAGRSRWDAHPPADPVRVLAPAAHRLAGTSQAARPASAPRRLRPCLARIARALARGERRLLLGPPAEVPGQEALGGGIEAQPVLRLGEAVPLVREQHVLMVDPGRHQGRDDLL